MRTLFLLSAVISFFPSALSALSRYVSIAEMAEQCPIIVVGSIGEERQLDSTDYKKPSITGYGVITRIRVEKVVKGSVSVGDELLLFRPAGYTTESPIYSTGERDLLFLKEAPLPIDLETKVQKRHGDEIELIRRSAHYAVRDQGVRFLGIDQGQAEKVKASSAVLYEYLLKRDSDQKRKERNRKHLESTEKFLKMMSIQDAAEREKALNAAISGDDEALMRAAKYELQQSDPKRREKRVVK